MVAYFVCHQMIAIEGQNAICIDELPVNFMAWNKNVQQG